MGQLFRPFVSEKAQAEPLYAVMCTGTMSDEIGFFSHGIFDEVRGSPCTASPRLACASWLLLYLPFSDPSAASCPAAVPDQAA